MPSLKKSKVLNCFILAIIVSLAGAVVLAQPVMIKESNTPIALHYAGILQDYIAFIKPKLHPKADLISITKTYFDSKDYRVVTISIHSDGPPKIDQSWKPPHTKLAVLPRMSCWVLPTESIVELYDQGDDYVMLHNHMGETESDPNLRVSVGITHMWK
jgi:hypothetical protein